MINFLFSSTELLAVKYPMLSAEQYVLQFWICFVDAAVLVKLKKQFLFSFIAKFFPISSKKVALLSSVRW